MVHGARLRRMGAKLLVVLFSSFFEVTSTNLDGTTVLITAPPSYSSRLKAPLENAGAKVVACPTIVTDLMSDQELQSLREVIHDASSYDFLAFTSRRGIQAAMQVGGTTLIQALQKQAPTAIALGKDGEPLLSAGIDRSCILTPDNPSPDGIVSLLESMYLVEKRKNVRILCPVPKVIGELSEPPVVPNFLANLRRKGFEVHSVNAYITRLADFQANSVKEAMKMLKDGIISVVCVSSTAEVEAFLLFCQRYQVEWKHVKIAAHGPVTASGAQALGVTVHAVSKDSSSFYGMVEAVTECMS